MTKKIWRGTSVPSNMKIIADNVHNGQGKMPHTCTVVGDTACFPVKEAMRLCEAATVVCGMCEDDKGYWEAHFNMATASDKFKSAVEHMKNKTGKK